MSIYVNIYVLSQENCIESATTYKLLFGIMNIKKIAFYGRKRLFGVSTLNSSYTRQNNGSKSLDEASDYMYPASGYLASG